MADVFSTHDITTVDQHIYLWGLVTDVSMLEACKQVRETTKQLLIEQLLLDLPQPRQLIVHINTNGGDAFSCFALYDLIRRAPVPTLSHVEGLAASAGSILMLAADRRLITPSSQVMIHQPWGISGGNVDEKERSLRMSKNILQVMVDIYHERTGNSKSSLRRMMQADTWMTAQQAVDNGFAHEVK